MAEIAVLGANPVNALPVRVRLGWRFVERRLASRVYFLDAPALFLSFFLRQFAQPAHLLGDLLLGFVRVAIFIQQLPVLVRARVGLLQELLVIVIVPGFFGVFLPAFL